MAFPDGFWWGTAASSTQAEGAAPASDWAAWERLGRAPASGGGNGFATRYAQDFALLAAHGLTHHRLSIDWARVEPAEGRCDEAAIEHYQRVLAAAREAGMHVWACLHHFSVPGWFLDEGGFVEDAARDRYWARHVERCAETFGGDVFGWMPINEPVAYAAASYLQGDFPPGRRDGQDFAKALRGMHYAWRDAWRELRGGGAPVATVYHLTPVFPTDDSPAARRAAGRVDEVVWRCWMRALTDGTLAVPGLPEVEVPGLAGSGDLIGFSYYNAIAVAPDLSFHPYPSSARVGPMGYAPWSEGLGVVLHRLHDELPDRSFVVAEHGVGTTDDAWRCDVLRASLAEVEGAIADGVDVRGFFHWTGVDNYEWLHGYQVPFGLFDTAREPRESAALLASYARAGSAAGA